MDKNYGDGVTRANTAKAIESAVAYFFGMRTDELHQKSMARAVEMPQRLVMYLMKQMTDASVLQIARHYGRKYTGRVDRAIAKLEERRRTSGVVDLVIRELIEGTEMRLAHQRRGSVTKLWRPM
jgi:chromosomal replication initiator protein